MLKYSFKQLEFDGDIVEIDINSATIANYGYGYGSTMSVTFRCLSTPKVRIGDYVKAISVVPFYNDIREEWSADTEVSYHKVTNVDPYSKTITIIPSKYKTLEVTNCYIKDDENGDEYWYFDVNGSHMYRNEDSGSCKFYLLYNEMNYLYIDNAEVVDFETFRWKYDKDVENAYNCKRVIFPEWADNSQFGRDTSRTPNALIRKVTVTRPQVRWDYYSANETGLNLYASIYKVSLDVPIELHSEVRLHAEDNIREYFVEKEKDNAINGVNEMEKRQYVPVIKTNSGFVDVQRINFNLHFREHSGENWTVENSDTWNFVKYGYNMLNDKYYPYTDRENQADLLCYAAFENKDVKFQKNVLKKSFIRLMFYDSMNPGKQNMLGYSTIFFDNGKLYSKYLKNCNLPVYYTRNDEDAVGIRVDREVNKSALTTLVGSTTMSDDEIEEYRLSCRFTTENTFITNNSSEGFYLYLWADNDGGIVPENIYMKVDFNHAGYGRTIPFMSPYWDQDIDGKRGFKSNTEIKEDWEGEGYGIQKYLRYTYIRLQYMYDKENNRHVYYLNPEHYGQITGNVLNINLYEGRVTY